VGTDCHPIDEGGRKKDNGISATTKRAVSIESEADYSNPGFGDTKGDRRIIVLYYFGPKEPFKYLRYDPIGSF
jgi:hypothetical protein